MTPFCLKINNDQSTHFNFELWRCHRLYSKTIGIQPRFLKTNVLLTWYFRESSEIVLTISTCFVLWWPERDPVKTITLISKLKRLSFRRCVQKELQHLRPHALLSINIPWFWSSFWLITRPSYDSWKYKCWKRRDFSLRRKSINTWWD